MKINDDNYIHVPARARLELDLKGNDLLVYSVIHGFTQDNHSWKELSLQYICDWIGVSDKSRVSIIINRLVEIGAIEKEDYFVNNVKFCRYRVKPLSRSGNHNTTVVETTTKYNIDNIPPTTLFDNKDSIPQGGECVTELGNLFEKFRKAYKGTKRGFQTEFDNFRKKHKDWKQVVTILLDRYNNQQRLRETAKAKGLFVPQEKNLQTYLNQRCWEEEPTFGTGSEVTQQQKEDNHVWDY